MIDQYLDARHKVAVHIPPGEMQEVLQYLRADYPEVVVLENALDEMSFSSADPPPP